jgi:hypothetical protein
MSKNRKTSEPKPHRVEIQATCDVVKLAVSYYRVPDVTDEWKSPADVKKLWTYPPNVIAFRPSKPR